MDMLWLTSTLHHLFIPSHRNNFRAKLLHLDFLIVLIAAATLLSFGTGWLEKTEILGIAQDIRIEKLFQLTNEARQSQGLPPLHYSNQLAHAAENKAQHMITNNYWAHFGSGRSPWDFILASGYSYEVAGENLAKGFMFSEGVVDGWRNSSTHWANITKAEYDDVGFAVMNGALEGEETTLVVQMFGKRLAQEQPVEPKDEKQLADVGLIKPAQASGVESTAAASAVQPKGENDFVPATIKNSWQISINTLAFSLSTALFGLLLVVLLVDLVMAHRFGIVRLTGKNIAHVIFIATLIIGLYFIKNGGLIL